MRYIKKSKYFIPHSFAKINNILPLNEIKTLEQIVTIILVTCY